MRRQVMGPEIVPAQSGPAWKSFPQGDLVSRKTRRRAGYLPSREDFRLLTPGRVGAQTGEEPSLTSRRTETTIFSENSK